MVFLEDVLAAMLGRAEGCDAGRRRSLLPAWLLVGAVRPRGPADALATVIFSSGSTGVPKGVMLTHRNILANIDAIAQVFQLTTRRRDRRRAAVLSLLRLHRHAVVPAGRRASAWSTIPIRRTRKTIGELAEQAKGDDADQHADVLRRLHAQVRAASSSRTCATRWSAPRSCASRSPTAFQEKFGVDLLEGYGCTEMAPVVAVNVPDVDDAGMRQRGSQPGTVGHPLPGVVAKVVDPATGEGPLIGTEGLLLVNGPNRMMGYLGEPERPREVLRDGWYVTGDIALDRRGRASSASPTACRASARSPARWCRT